MLTQKRASASECGSSKPQAQLERNSYRHRHRISEVDKRLMAGYLLREVASVGTEGRKEGARI